MTYSRGISFGVLGALEARLDGESLPLGGAKQRAVLAVLLLSANEVISVERLIDEVWGDRSPPSAAHSLEAYVSRIRQLLNGHGPTLTRRGAGYRLDLGGATLDADLFAQELQGASDAAAEGDLGLASVLASRALALWHGPALADVSLASAGRAEAERLEEARLRAFELRFDAELDLGHNEAIVGELQVLVGQNPYRERFVAQLMLTLYRSGRQAEALEVYEQTRRRLDDDLGLQPSGELRQLSGQIVRQDPQLRTPAAAVRSTPRESARPRARRLSGVVLSGALVTAAMVLTASGSAAQNAAEQLTDARSKRVALVLSSMPEGVSSDPRAGSVLTAFRQSSDAWGYDSEILTGRSIDRVARRMDAGKFELVIVLGDGPDAQALAARVRRSPATHFVFLDASPAMLPLAGAPNATVVRYAADQSSHLAGYLSGLVPPRGSPSKERADMVSIVAGLPTADTNRVVRGFARGVRRSLPNVVVRVDYTNEVIDPTACELIANKQIDAGSDVVFAVAKRCGLGALAVARTRGVWGIGTEEDAVPGGPHILATTYRDVDRAVRDSIDDFEFDSLRPGEIVRGLNEDYAVGIDKTSYVVSDSIWSKVVHRCSQIRQHTAIEET